MRTWWIYLRQTGDGLHLVATLLATPPKGYVFIGHATAKTKADALERIAKGIRERFTGLPPEKVKPTAQEGWKLEGQQVGF